MSKYEEQWEEFLAMNSHNTTDKITKARRPYRDEELADLLTGHLLNHPNNFTDMQIVDMVTDFTSWLKERRSGDGKPAERVLRPTPNKPAEIVSRRVKSPSVVPKM